MGKLSCNVCGTVYPSSADKCPICGGSRNDATAVNNSDSSVAIAKKKAEKGGHFTKSNVKKRNKAATEVVRKNPVKVTQKTNEPEKSGKGFGTLLTILLLIAAGIAVYIVMTYALPFIQGQKKPVTTEATETHQATLPTTEQVVTEAPETDVPREISCTGLSVDKSSFVFTEKGETASVSVVPSPFNTTNSVVFSSLDPSVATVDAYGNILAVGKGETEIVITCGNVETKCRVKCSFSDETTEPANETKPQETVAPDALVINREDFTLFFKGDSFKLEAEGIDGSDTVWKSEDPYIASVSSEGEVKAVHKGITTVTASYAGKTASCIVRCDFPDDSEGIFGSENESSGGNTGSDTPADYIISHIDVTIYVGNSFELELYDRDGETVDVSWVSNNSGIASVFGNEITGVSGGTTTIFCTYGGRTYQCIVRVYNE